MSNKKQIRKVIKGLSQDALNGLAAPELAGVFEATGQQSIQPATLGLSEALVRGITPSNGNPGPVGSLMGGESPYLIGAEQSGGLDLTKATKKALKKRLKAALKNANNNGDITPELMAAIVGAAHDAADVQSVGGSPQPKYVSKALKKAAKDPAALLARVDDLAAKLTVKQRTNPFATSALTAAARNRRRAELAAGVSASAAKGMASLDAGELLGAIDDLERVLGLTPSAAGFSPTQISADSQLRRIVGGGPSESLRGTQNVAAAAVGGPAAQLGLALKSGLGEEIAQAEQQVANALATGRSEMIQQAESDRTKVLLKAEALATFGSASPFGGR